MAMMSTIAPSRQRVAWRLSIFFIDAAAHLAAQNGQEDHPHQDGRVKVRSPRRDGLHGAGELAEQHDEQTVLGGLFRGHREEVAQQGHVEGPAADAQEGPQHAQDHTQHQPHQARLHLLGGNPVLPHGVDQGGEGGQQQQDGLDAPRRVLVGELGRHLVEKLLAQKSA